MADFERRLKIAEVLCASFAAILIVLGVMIYLTLTGTIELKFLYDSLSGGNKIDLSSPSIVLLFSFAPTIIGIFLLYCAILCRARKNFTVGIIILVAATMFTLMPVLNIPGMIIVPIVGCFVIWLFASSKYEFY